MKKIVALVLSLVMALSLCTVAFAYETGDKFYSDENGTVTYTYNEASSYKAGNWTANGSNNNHVAYFAGSNGKFYLVGGANGKTLWLNGLTKATDITLGDEIVAYGADYKYVVEEVQASDWSCTTDKYDAGYKTKDADGNVCYLKVANKTDAGAFPVLLGTEIKYAVPQENVYGMKGQHILCVPTSGEKVVGVGVYEGYCAACHQFIKYAKTQVNAAGALFTNDTTFAKTLIAQGKVAVPAGYSLYTGEWYLVGETTATKPAEGVNSAKTFDAGVAMYVGMSLLSVAGGAVVIGKKKEF